MRTGDLSTQNAYRAAALVMISLTFCVGVSNHLTAVHGQTADGLYGSNTKIRIGVLGLFHPREVRIQAIAGQALIVQTGGERVMLEPSSGDTEATIRLSGAGIAVTTTERGIRGSAVTVAGRASNPADFILRIPGKISRRYHGTLEIVPSADSLLAIVTVDRETAVASVVAAESAAKTPVEALKAQAIAARSYFVAGRGRHREFDFCDTTHCQFLRDPPAPDSDVAVAVEATRGLVLAYEDQPFAAMYTRSCSGHTHTPAELGIRTISYPYYPVACEYCRSHPANWTSRLAAQDAGSLRSSDESARLKAVRQLGWSAVPSNDFVVTKDGDQVVLRGIGNGHGIGLCQAGAKAMAESGATFREILNHYYPNTSIVSMEREVAPHR